MALLMTVYFFLAMASVSVVKSLQNALYLGKVGFDWRLPSLYVVLAAVSGVGVLFYRRLGRRYSRIAINFCTLLALIVSLLGFFLVLAGQADWVYPVFYVWGGIFSILVPTQGWLLSYELYTTREAKRLFSVLGTGGILGGAGGGFYAAWAGEAWGVHWLLLQVAVVLAVMQALLTVVGRRRTSTYKKSNPTARPKEAASSPLREVLGSPYLATLAALILMSACATTLIDLQYKWVLEEKFAGSPDDINGFFGNLLGATFLFSAVFQLFGTSRLLRTLGVGTGLLAMPAALVLGSIPTFLLAGFATVVLLKVVDGCLRTSVHKTSVELIYMPVSSPDTASLKGFIELVVFRCGDALGAAVFLAASALIQPASATATVGIAVFAASGLWAYLAWRLGREYARTLRDALERRAGPGFRRFLQSREAAAEKTLVEALRSSSGAKVHFALEQIIESVSGKPQESYPVADESGELVFHGAAGGGSGTPRWLEEVEPLLGHPNREVAAAALHLLIAYRPEQYLSNLRSNCESDRIPDLLCLHYLERYVENPQKYLTPDRLIRWSGECEAPAARVLIRLMSKTSDPAFLDVLRGWADHSDRALAAAAVRAIGPYRRPEDVDRLLATLGRPWSRKAAGIALAHYGDPLAPRLLQLLNDRGVDVSIKRELPLVLTRIGSPAAQDALVTALYLHDPVVSFRALKGLNKIRARRTLPFGEISFSPVLQIWVREHYELLNLDLLLGPARSRGERLLKKAIRERLDWGTEKIFRGLELFLPPGDAYFSYLGFTGRDPTLRENAIELIDVRIKGELRQTILPIITGHSQREIVQIGRRLYRLPTDLDRVLSEALFQADPWLKCCIITAVKDRGRENLRDRVRQAAQDIHPVVRETAGWAIASWSFA